MNTRHVNPAGATPVRGVNAASSAASAGPSASRLPPAIVNKLMLMIRRIRRIVLLRGALSVAATAMALTLALMALDAAVVMLPRNVHAVLSLCALLATAAVAWQVIIRPLGRKHTLTAIARVLEIRHPALQERISSAIELLDNTGPAAMRGSEALIADLVKAAETDALAVEPRMEFTIRTAKPYLMAVSAMAGAVGILLLIWPQSTSRLLARTLIPYANVGNAYASLLSVTPGNGRIPFGDALTISARVQTPGMSRAEVLRVGENGSETVERMESAGSPPAGASVFSMKFPSVQEGFRYRVRAGHALSGYYQIRVERRPDVERVKVSYEYPHYSGLAPKTVEGAPGDIAAPAGSKVTLWARFTKPVVVADLLVSGKAVSSMPAEKGSAEPAMERAWDVSPARGQAESFCFHLVDEIGMTNQPANFRMQCVADARPTVTLSEPVAPTLKLKPTEIVPISYLANDDYGIRAATLFVNVDGGRSVVIDLPPPARNGTKRDSWGGRELFNLSSLDLSGARTVSVRIGVTDTLPPDLHGPQTGLSEVVSIQIDRQAASLAQQTVASLEAQIRAEMAAARAKLQEARGKAADRAGGASPGLPDIKDVHGLAGDAEDILRNLAERTGRSPFAELSGPLSAIADNHVEPARKSAEMIPLTDNDAERAKDVTSMRQDLKDAVAALDELAGRMDKAAADAQRLADLMDLANRQEQLAQAARDLATRPPPSAKDETRKWKESQDEMLKRLANMLKNDPASLDRQMEANRKEAEALAEAARKLANEQKELADQALQSDGALKQQGDIAKKAEDLTDDTGELAEKMEKLGTGPQDPKARSAEEAQRDMESANDNMKKAMDKMAKESPAQQGGANPPPPGNDQQAAQQQASQQLQEASDKLAQLAKAMEPAGKPADAAMPPNSQPPAAQPDSDIKHSADGDMPATPGDADQKQDKSPPNSKEPDTNDTGSGGPGGKGNTSPGETKAPPTPLNPKPGGPDAGVGSDTGSGAPGSGSKGKGQGSGEPSKESSSEASTGTSGSTPAPGKGNAAPGGEKPGGPGSAPAPGGDPSLDTAFDEAAGAATASSMAEAAPSATRAANELSQLAAATAQKMGMPSASRPGGKPGQQKGGSPGGPGGGAPGSAPDGSGTPGAGNDLAASEGKWLKSKTALSGNVRDAAEDSTATDYRDLVKRYFKAVAHEGDKQE